MDAFLAAIAAALIGAGSALGGVVLTQRQAMRVKDRERRDVLRREQVQASLEFLASAHDIAHRLGKCHPGCPGQIMDADEITATYLAVDKELSPVFRKLEVTSTKEVVLAAGRARQALYDFREPFSPDEDSTVAPTYMSDAYREVLGAYQAARDAFVQVARQEAMTLG
jgi:hypothetical protein